MPENQSEQRIGERWHEHIGDEPPELTVLQNETRKKCDPFHDVGTLDLGPGEYKHQHLTGDQHDGDVGAPSQANLRSSRSRNFISQAGERAERAAVGGRGSWRLGRSWDA